MLRDVEVVPALRPILEGGLMRGLERMRALLAEPFLAGARGRRRERIAAGARAATDFHTWRALAPLGDTEAADLAAALVERAAGG